MRIQHPPPVKESELYVWLQRLQMQLDTTYENSDTWNPGSIANGSEEAKEVTVTGAELGDFAIASFSLDVQDLSLTANVTAANTVTCVLSNSTGGAVDLAEGTIRALVIKKDFL